MERTKPPSETEYCYDPLKEPGNIRLIILYRAALSEDIIYISLREVPLEDCAVRFAALSYTWATEDGDCSLARRVECKSTSTFIRVTQNCEAALRRLRTASLDLVVWIDAICIYQSDDSERCTQVQLMRQIYRTADFVPCWLGEASVELDEANFLPISDLGMDFVHQLAAEIREYKNNARSGEHGPLYEELFQNHERCMIEGIRVCSPNVRGFLNILLRHWWRRVLVAQEAALNSTAMILCGSKSLTFRDLDTVIDSMAARAPVQTDEEFAYAQTFLVRPFSIFLMRDYKRRSALWPGYAFLGQEPGQIALAILLATRNLRATDPRDKVYGILGFFGPPEVDPENILPLPDYEKTAAQVYSETSRAIMLKSRSLDVMSDSYGFLTTVQGLPSWAASWNHDTLHRFLEKQFRASRNSSAVVCKDVTAWQTIGLKGKRSDIVRCMLEVRSITYTASECVRLWKDWWSVASSSLPHAKRPDEYRQSYYAWLEIFKPSHPLAKITDDLFSEGAASPFTKRVESSSWGRSLCITANDLLGLVPVSSQPGDLIVVFSGAKIPFVLTPKGDNFKVVGPCYVHGIMDGEAFPEDYAESSELEWFTLE